MSPQAVSFVSGVLFLLAAIAFDLYCLRDLQQREPTDVFPPQTWLLVIVFFTPFGGIAYLKVGRGR